MKISLKSLPEAKQLELNKVVKTIRKHQQPEMVILFGSYARGDYVESDTHVEDDIVYEFKSDFDILVIVRSENIAHEYKSWGKIRKKLRGDESIKSPVRLIVEDIGFVNEQLELGRYFYADIKKEGIELYNSGKHKLAMAKKLSPAESKKIAQEDYDMWIEKSERFLETHDIQIKKGWNNEAAFNLHQATEALYTTVLLVFTGYKPKTHDLYELGDLAVEMDKRFGMIFPKTTQADEELFGQLNSAYVDARYKKDYFITKSELKVLANRVKKLFDLVKQVCQKKIG